MENKAIEAEITRFVWVFTEAKKLVGNDTAAASVTAEVGKAIRMAEIVAERQALRNGTSSSIQNSDEDAPATEKQLGYLRALKIPIPKGLSKSQASAMIDEATAPY